MKGRSLWRLPFLVSLGDKGTRNRADADAASSASHLFHEGMEGGKEEGRGNVVSLIPTFTTHTKLLCHMIRFPYLIEFQDPLLQRMTSQACLSFISDSCPLVKEWI